MLLDLFLLMYSDLSMPLSCRVYASDARPGGAGEVYAALDKRTIWEFKDNVSETRCRKGWYSAILIGRPELNEEFVSSTEKAAGRRLKVSCRFERAIKRLRTKTAISTAWRWPHHINQFELEAFLLSVWHMTSFKKGRGHSIVPFSDNTSALGAVTKGRSSSWAMNKVCRKTAHFALKANFSCFGHWIPSEVNPSDTPSHPADAPQKDK